MTAAQHIIRLPPPWQVLKSPQGERLFCRRFGRPTGLQPHDRIELVVRWQDESSRGDAAATTVDGNQAGDRASALTIARVQLNDINLTDINPTDTKLTDTKLTDTKLTDTHRSPPADYLEEPATERVLRLDVTSRLLPRNEVVVHAQLLTEAVDLPFRVQLEIFVGGRQEVVTDVVE
jgi:hypothetical protein